MNNRRLLLAVIVVTVFAIGVISWFFFYATPKKAPSLGGTNNPLSLKTFPKGFQFIFPIKEDAPVQESTTEVTFQKPEVLTEIWSKPATGQTFVEYDTVQEVDATSTKGTTTVAIKKLTHATTTILMFVDRTTGYVYAYNREIGKVYQVSNTTIPGVYDAYIFNNGKMIILRYIDNDKQTIVGVLANIPSVNEKQQAAPLESISYLPSQVTSVAINRAGTLASYLVTGDNGGSIYTISMASKKPDFVVSTPLTELTLAYGGNTLFATTKPSAYMIGYTFRVPSFEFTLGDKTGLVSNPGDSGLFVASMWSNTGLKTFLSLYGKQVVLSVSTIASKCAWGDKNYLLCSIPKTVTRKVEGLPDDWFQGRTLFNDSFVLIDSKTAEVYPYYSFTTPNKLQFDVTNISVSKNNTYIAFTRKQNASLWLLDSSLVGNDQ